YETKAANAKPVVVGGAGVVAEAAAAVASRVNTRRTHRTSRMTPCPSMQSRMKTMMTDLLMKTAGSVNRSRARKARRVNAKRVRDGVDDVAVAAAAGATGNAMARRRFVRTKTGLSWDCTMRSRNSRAR